VADQVAEILVVIEAIVTVEKVYIIQHLEEVTQLIRIKMRNLLHIHVKLSNSSY